MADETAAAEAQQVEVGQSPATSSAPAFQEGEKIVAHGLVGARQLNHLPGRILSFDESKERYGVFFFHDGSKKSLKGENLRKLQAPEEKELREIFSTEVASQKFKKLIEERDFGFVEFEDENLQRLVGKLLLAGYWAENVAVMQDVAEDLNLSFMPKFARAVELVRMLETSESMSDAIAQAGEEVSQDS
eukprot:CAMPEP_0206491508 /NCGR_PEP_ID=MMETSP0324_2-20121206/45075_1 /ASSEMBLY_ACC=CAM_ASM_000836 /TAXON_ID=2866 /ORGANISM="Crypthecodinium cohnii, Strain Seligo" /LENGTH=188 /DNA_ID=CAMNT_0053972787 /DNA_START=18 /DNA_END=580 /DNA_ORIENTATION=-